MEIKSVKGLCKKHGFTIVSHEKPEYNCWGEYNIKTYLPEVTHGRGNITILYGMGSECDFYYTSPEGILLKKIRGNTLKECLVKLDEFFTSVKA